ncbi:MAG: hypothetical protein Q3979_02640 [Actinomycetaceae bacterium]|nr:hypothetical protein [Actinomycetaceae bacterium]
MFTASIGVFLFGLIAAIAGGAVGAAIGGNYGFVLTGFCVLASWGVLAATGSSFGLDYLAFGPFMGPHIVFAGGAAAAIYAYYKGQWEDGKDVNAPLAGTGRASIMLVGSAFGVFGYIFQIGITQIPWFGSHTDSVALTVVTSGIIARILFGGKPGEGIGRGKLLSAHNFDPEAKTFFQKIAPGPNGRWLEWQERPAPLLVIGSLFGIFAGGASIFLGAVVGSSLVDRGLADDIADNVAVNNAQTFTFGISAVIILFLITNRNMPVQHHVTITAGLAAMKFFPIVNGSFQVKDGDVTQWIADNAGAASAALIIAAVAGIFAAFLCEFFGRLWYARGPSHIDPPAAAIWICNTTVVGLAQILA